MSTRTQAEEEKGEGVATRVVWVPPGVCGYHYVRDGCTKVCLSAGKIEHTTMCSDHADDKPFSGWRCYHHRRAVDKDYVTRASDFIEVEALGLHGETSLVGRASIEQVMALADLGNDATIAAEVTNSDWYSAKLSRSTVPGFIFENALQMFEERTEQLDREARESPKTPQQSRENEMLRDGLERELYSKVIPLATASSPDKLLQQQRISAEGADQLTRQQESVVTEAVETASRGGAPVLASRMREVAAQAISPVQKGQLFMQMVENAGRFAQGSEMEVTIPPQLADLACDEETGELGAAPLATTSNTFGCEESDVSRSTVLNARNRGLKKKGEHSPVKEDEVQDLVHLARSAPAQPLAKHDSRRTKPLESHDSKALHEVTRNWVAPAKPEAVAHLSVRRGLSGGMIPVGRDPLAYTSVAHLRQEQDESVVANQSFRANREVQSAVDRQNRGPGWGNTQQQQAHAAQAHVLQHQQQQAHAAQARALQQQQQFHAAQAQALQHLPLRRSYGSSDGGGGQSETRRVHEEMRELQRQHTQELAFMIASRAGQDRPVDDGNLHARDSFTGSVGGAYDERVAAPPPTQTAVLAQTFSPYSAPMNRQIEAVLRECESLRAQVARLEQGGNAVINTFTGSGTQGAEAAGANAVLSTTRQGGNESRVGGGGGGGDGDDDDDEDDDDGDGDGGGNSGGNRWNQRGGVGRHRHGGEIPQDKAILKKALKAARAWAPGNCCPDLDMMFELRLNKTSMHEQNQALAWGTEGVYETMKRRLHCYEQMCQSVARFLDVMRVRVSCYDAEMRRLKGNGSSDLAYLLSAADRRELELEGVGAGTNSRQAALLTESNNQWNKIASWLTEQDSKGQGMAFLKMLLEKVLEPIQEERLKYRNHRTLALRAAYLKKEKFISNENGSRCMDYFEAGLFGQGGGGITRNEVRGLAEGAARRTLEAGGFTGGSGGGGTGGGAGGGAAGSGAGINLADLPRLPLCREVETMANGDSIRTRDGVTWKGSTCAFCARAGRWCGHHKDQCVKNPDSPLFGK